MTATVEIVVSEVTALGGRIGIAGWCPAEGRMIRPSFQADDMRWPVAMADRGPFAVGAVVRLTPTGIPTGRPEPYAREDLVVDPEAERVGTLTGGDLMAALRPSESVSVVGVFGTHLRDGTHVRVGDPCPSLVAISTWAGRTMAFDEWERDGQPRLRCVFCDGNGIRLSLSVVSRQLRAIHDADGIDGLTDLARRHRTAHVRLGLELPDEQGRAYLRVNDILFH